MKSAAFEYARPASVAETCRMLAEYKGEAQILAGGQSLMPLLAARLAQPALLIDINHIAELQGMSASDDRLVIAGCTRQRAAERASELPTHCPLLLKALRHVGHVQTRNRGTVGGSLCQADPAAEIPLTAVTLEAEFTLTSPGGARRIAAADFITGAMETGIAEDECLTAVAFPIWPDGRCGTAFDEVSMRHGDFALVSAAVQLALDDAGRCSRIALGLGNAGATPARMSAAEEALLGTSLDEAAIDAAMDTVAAAIDPFSDTQATAAYRRRVAPRLLRRTLLCAVAEARGAGA